MRQIKGKGIQVLSNNPAVYVYQAKKGNYASIDIHAIDSIEEYKAKKVGFQSLEVISNGYRVSLNLFFKDKKEG